MLANDAAHTPLYTIEPKNPYFEAIRSMAEYEIRPGITVTFLGEIDLTEIERIRARCSRADRPTYTAFVVKATSLALKEFPYANRRVAGRAWLPWTNRLQTFHRIDVAIACERDYPGAESLAFVDTIRQADVASMSEIGRALRGFANADPESNSQLGSFLKIIHRCPTWLTSWLIGLPCFVPSMWVKYRGGAALISSPAKYGVDTVVAAWSFPIGISFGLVKKRPVVKDDQVVPCQTFTLTMNFDRRVMAGAQGARFFKRLVEILEHAETEMDGFLPAAEAQPANGQPAPEPAGAH